MHDPHHRASPEHRTRPGIRALRTLIAAALQAARDWRHARLGRRQLDRDRRSTTALPIAARAEA